MLVITLIIYLLSETKYFEKKRKFFSNYKKKTQQLLKIRDDKKTEPEKQKPDIKNIDDFPPLQ